MNQLKDYILETGTLLYRYDLKEPPKDWSKDFKNPEYVYSDLGVKNQVGAFFFFDSHNQATNTAQCAVQRHPNIVDGIWITMCTIKKTVKLLDLRDFQFCTGLLFTLEHQKYNILIANFRTWQGVPFSDMSKSLQTICDISLEDSNWFLSSEKSKNIDSAILNVESILGFPNDNIGALCQLFTDYSNGEVFKNLLIEKGYEGYIFNESNHSTGSNTLCIFESNKFWEPTTLSQERANDNPCMQPKGS